MICLLICHVDLSSQYISQFIVTNEGNNAAFDDDCVGKIQMEL